VVQDFRILFNPPCVIPVYSVSDSRVVDASVSDARVSDTIVVSACIAAT
jgi:hypothetical protein